MRTLLRNMIITAAVSSSMLAAAFFVEAHAQSDPGPGVLILPVAGYSTDEKLQVGFMAGISDRQGSRVYLTTYYATAGRYVVKANGQRRLDDGLLTGDAAVRYARRMLYTTDSAPEEYARAMQGRVLLNAARLYTIHLTDGLHLGPGIKINHTWTNDVTDPEGTGIPTPPDRFTRGGFAVTGVQARWATADAMRPVDGWLLETGLYGGVAYGERMPETRPDLHGDLKLAAAAPLTDALRIYIRGMGGFQLEAPAPTQLFIGGESTLRGHADQRDWGRRQLAGRLQVHYRMFKNVTWPIRLVHSIWSGFPTPGNGFDLETVPFMDVGATGDPSWGWSPTRTGAGVGFRAIFPPDLVFHMDLGYSPDFGFRVYVGAGETL